MRRAGTRRHFQIRTPPLTVGSYGTSLVFVVFAGSTSMIQDSRAARGQGDMHACLPAPIGPFAAPITVT